MPPDILGGCEKTIIFRQYDAPPHYSKWAKTYLNKEGLDNWTERCGPGAWCSLFFDLTAYDSFLRVLSYQR